MKRDKVKWFSGKFVADQGVVVGADKKHEWMLTFWFDHFTDHNSYPVCFADFGMSPQMVEWCKNRGTVIDLTYKTERTWFKKPMAILQSPFKDVLWTDVDCQIKKPLGPIFQYAKGFGTTFDPYRSDMKGANGRVVKKPVTSGVIATHNGNELTLKWAVACLTPENRRGDQEVLNYLVTQGDDNINIMPHNYQSLRMDEHTRHGIDPDSIIVHWTGPKGKKRIKEIMLDKKLFGNS